MTTVRRSGQLVLTVRTALMALQVRMARTVPTVLQVRTVLRARMVLMARTVSLLS
jgi:hypothetical protein